MNIPTPKGGDPNLAGGRSKRPLIRRLFGWMFPEDKDNGCGYGIFKLPEDHPFSRGCNLHDSDYALAHEGLAEKTKDIVDWDLFWRWTLLTRAEQDPARRIQLCYDICKYWPLAQIGGNLMWDGK